MDAVVILGARIGQDGYPGRVARFRLQYALPLVIEAFPESYVVITGGRLPGRPCSEAKAMGDWAVQQAAQQWGGAAARRLAARLLPEEHSRNTAESAHYTALLLAHHGLKRAGVVTDTLHMPRVRYLFARTFEDLQLEFQPWPAPGLLQDYWRRRRFLRLSKFLLWEAGAWLKVWGRKVW
ncbi:MAG: YdcF family protein [Desulfobacca sp.]|uniref:YdcF family protein n=1 Tax=Desulfobacca sp. TaxID=2067990 RepID=UPI0040496E7A